MLQRVGAAMVVTALFVVASGAATLTAAADSFGVKQSRDASQDRTSKSKTDDSPLSADQKKCERSGGLWVNGFCELEG